MPALSWVTGGLLAAGCVLVSDARAELPPMYTDAADLKVVLDAPALSEKLRGPAESVERIKPGVYRVRSGSCHVIASVTRRGLTDAQGRPVAGPSRIVGVELSEWRC